MERVHAIQAHITNNYHWLCVQCSEWITRWYYLSAKTIKMQRIFFAQVRYIFMRVLIYRYIFFFPSNAFVLQQMHFTILFKVYLVLIHVINVIVFVIFFSLQTHHSSFNRQDLRRNHHRLVRQSVKDVRKFYSAMRQVSAQSMQACNSNGFPHTFFFVLLFLVSNTITYIHLFRI